MGDIWISFEMNLMNIKYTQKHFWHTIMNVFVVFFNLKIIWNYFKMTSPKQYKSQQRKITMNLLINMIQLNSKYTLHFENNVKKNIAKMI
jgi:hypothetical protein